MAKPIKLSNNKKRKISQLLAMAGEALQQRNPSQCMKACDEIEAIYPQHPDTLHLRGHLAMQNGDIEEALTRIQQAIDAAPKRAHFLASLGNLQLQKGDIASAMKSYRHALTIDTHDIASHLGLAGALMAQDQHQEALAVLEKIQKRNPGDSSIRMGLFQACHALNHHDAGRLHLEAIIARDTNNSDAHYGLALLAVEQGALEVARQHIQHTLQINPYHGDAWLMRVDLQHYEASNNDIEIMQQIKQQCPKGSDTDMKISFALAKVEDDLGHYNKAFSLLQDANTIRHQHSDFDTAGAIADIDQLIQGDFSEIAHQRQEHPAHPTCLFVVGMPRSGTTLVEQILAAHPDVSTLGENGHMQAAIYDTVGSTLSAAALNTLPDHLCSAIGENYLERIKENVGSKTCVCDKTLSHINLIGLIHRALPQACFIHLQRHPLDTCLSIYKNNLQGAHFGYAFDLSELKHYYAAYQRLMQHWAKVLPHNTLYNMTYEQLVEHQEEQTRALLHACTLNWNESCMHFQHATHPVQTASAIQVRKPLSARSIGLWQHYEQPLSQLQTLCQSTVYDE
ncbi:sulfotransferase family protein [Mariprofundus sp. EBB-1]|uniref:tetratricopeptide repeat-containing sulfotransferase family protein n=1 Tax=Mariprofundus sp. EBB-1 TaxID=2650971 RepID=UPI000EF1A9E4|nr:sulfotransferase [Mariprofundus sp. EBB-1]RLL55530.1 sulfotransferase family protein [Mariprofundus sp. EBB-1]